MPPRAGDIVLLRPSPSARISGKHHIHIADGADNFGPGYSDN